jgi:hypothetical protein
MLCPEAFEPSEGSLPLLSPPLGMWKLFPPVPVAVLTGTGLPPLLPKTALAGALLVALLVGLVGVGLVGPDTGC